MKINVLNHVLACAVLAIGLTAIVSHAQSAAPTVSEITKLKASNAFYKKQVAFAKYSELKLAYEAAVVKLQAEFADADTVLNATTDVAFKESGVDKTKFDFNPETGAFVPKPAPDEKK